MEEKVSHTPTELLAISNKLKSKHEILKSDVLYLLDEVEEKQNNINSKIQEIKNIENEYVEIMQLMSQIK